MKSFKKVLFSILALLISVNVNAESININSQDSLKTCVDVSGNICILTDNITTTETITLDNDVTIDLNGYSITNSTKGLKAFDITKGKVIFTGKGIIESGPNSTSGIRILGSSNLEDTNYTVVTLDKDVTLKSWGYGAFISFNKNHAFGVVVNINGTIATENYAAFYVNGSVQDTEKNYPVININNATLTSKGGGFVASGYAEWNINNSYFEGEDSGIAIKSGKFNIKNSTVKATGLDSTPTEGFSNGINASGAAIQIESNSDYVGLVELNIDGGTYTSENGFAYYEYLASNSLDTSVKSFEIKNATLTTSNNKPVFKVSEEYSNKFTKTVTVKQVNGKALVNNNYLVGEEVKITLTPDEGYIFNSLTVVDEDNNEIKVNEDNKFIMPNSNVVINVTFIDEKTITPGMGEEKEELVTNVTVKEDTKLNDILLNSLKSNTELSQQLASTDVEVVVDVYNVDTNKLADNIFNSIKEKAGKATIASYFDIIINVNNSTNSTNVGTIKELTEEIELMFLLPEELKNTNSKVKRTYYVIREHDGEVITLDDVKLSEDGKYVTFKSDKFSVYALAYEDTVIEENPVIPPTSDNISLYIILGSLSVIGFAAVSIYVKKKKLFN